MEETRRGSGSSWLLSRSHTEGLNVTSSQNAPLRFQPWPLISSLSATSAPAHPLSPHLNPFKPSDMTRIKCPVQVSLQSKAQTAEVEGLIPTGGANVCT